MPDSRTEQLKQYMLAVPVRLKRSLLVFAYFLAIFICVGLPDGRPFEYAVPGAAIGLIIAAIAFFSGFFKLQGKIDESLKCVTAADTLTQVLDDFSAGTQIPKLGCIGQHYFFGQGTGTLVDLRKVQRIRYVREAYDDDGRTRYSHHLKFEVDGHIAEFVSLHNPACKKRAREALTLLDGRVPIDDDVRAKYLP